MLCIDQLTYSLYGLFEHLSIAIKFLLVATLFSRILISIYSTSNIIKNEKTYFRLNFLSYLHHSDFN